MSRLFWFLLQAAIICGMVWIVDDPKLTGAAALYGVLIALIVTGLLSRLLDWIACRPRQRTDAERDVERLRPANGHARNRPELSNSRRIGQYVRELVQVSPEPVAFIFIGEELRTTHRIGNTLCRLTDQPACSLTFEDFSVVGRAASNALPGARRFEDFQKPIEARPDLIAMWKRADRRFQVRSLLRISDQHRAELRPAHLVGAGLKIPRGLVERAFNVGADKITRRCLIAPR